MMRLPAALLLAAAANAQTALPETAPRPASPPQVLRIFRESIKPGKTAAHEKIRSAAARAMTRFQYPANAIALGALSGPAEIWIVESHDTFSSIETADTFTEKTPALKWWISQYEAQSADTLASSTRLLAAHRQDLSYRAREAAAAMPSMRYMSVAMVHLYPARDAEFTESVRLVVHAYEKAGTQQPMLVYQVVSGAQGLTYLFFSPMASLQTMDEAPMRGRAIRDAMGEQDAAKMLKTSAEVTAGTESFLFALNPKLSYVSKEFAGADPDFWTPKPPPRPAAPPATPGTQPATSPPAH